MLLWDVVLLMELCMPTIADGEGDRGLYEETKERPGAKLSEKAAPLSCKEVSEVAWAPAGSGVPHSQHTTLYILEAQI